MFFAQKRKPRDVIDMRVRHQNFLHDDAQLLNRFLDVLRRKTGIDDDGIHRLLVPSDIRIRLKRPQHHIRNFHPDLLIGNSMLKPNYHTPIYNRYPFTVYRLPFVTSDEFRWYSRPVHAQTTDNISSFTVPHIA